MAKTIAFEGGEGGGKGTTIRRLKEHLESNGKKVLVTREPGGTDIGEQIRSVILNSKNTKMTGITEALLFAACRSQLLEEVIRPALKNDEYDYIILDRYVYSSYVYQGLVRKVGLNLVQLINNITTKRWHPDIVFYLDLDPEIGLSRIEQNNRETNRLDKENLDFHKNVRAGYLKVAGRMRNFRIINADQSVDAVLSDVIEEVEKYEKEKEKN